MTNEQGGGKTGGGMVRTTILVDAVHTFVDEQGTIDQALYALLESYPQRKIILTNADYEADNKYRLNEMPYPVFTLKHNPKKIECEYYYRMLAAFGLRADEVIYFEHSPEAVASARAVGITTYQYVKGKRDLTALKRFLDTHLGIPD